MLAEISNRFEQNLSRVENLIGIYDNLVKYSRVAKRGAHDTDILRSALVFLHASMEDFLRAILSIRLPESDKEEIDKIPLFGQNKKDGEKFSLGSLVKFRDKNVDELIRISVSDYIEKWSSFNDIGQIKSAISKCGLESDGFHYEEIKDMVMRRHDIVHKADSIKVQVSGVYQVRPISVVTLNLYLKKVRELKNYVYDQLIPLEYCPHSSFASYADGVLYLLEKQFVQKNMFYEDMEHSRSKIAYILSDMIAIGHARLDHDGQYIHSSVKDIDEADAVIRRFCRNHVVYKELVGNNKYSNGFYENEFMDETISKCRIENIDLQSKNYRSKTLLRIFWASGYVSSRGDCLKILRSPASGPHSLTYYSLFSRKKFNMFFGESPPPTVVKALTGIRENNLGREESERKYGRNAIYALLKFGLVSIDGQPSIQKAMKGESDDTIVRVAALENNVVKYVCDLLEKNPNLSGVEVGSFVAEQFGCKWVPRSQQRNGAALARWAAWIGSYWTDKDTIKLRGDVNQMVSKLLSLKKEEYGTLPLIRRYSGRRESLSHGRPSHINDELYQAILILNNKYDLPISEIAERIGVSRSSIYRTSERSRAKLKRVKKVPARNLEFDVSTESDVAEASSWDYQEFRVGRAVAHHPAMAFVKRSPKMTAN